MSRICIVGRLADRGRDLGRSARVPAHRLCRGHQGEQRTMLPLIAGSKTRHGVEVLESTFLRVIDD